MGMLLVADLSRRNGGFEGWSRILPSVSEMMSKYKDAVELQTFCIKFLSNICTIPAHNTSICRDANVTICVLQAVERTATPTLFWDHVACVSQLCPTPQHTVCYVQLCALC